MKIKKIAEAPRIVSLENFPLGTIVNYDGELIPEGWEKVENLTVENICRYAYEETIIGEWVDGNPIYRKVINFGPLVNNTTKSVEINTEVKNLIRIYGYAIDTVTDYHPIIPLPYVHQNPIGLFVQTMNNTEKQVVTAVTYSDRTNFTESYVVIEYTKAEEV